MTVLEIALPTGYWIQQQDLDAYVKSSVVSNLKEARFEEKKLTFYFDHVSWPETFNKHVLSLLSFYSWAPASRVSPSPPRDGTPWPTWLATCPSRCTTTMLPSGTMNPWSTCTISTPSQYVTCAAAISVHTVPSLAVPVLCYLPTQAGHHQHLISSSSAWCSSYRQLSGGIVESQTRSNYR